MISYMEEGRGFNVITSLISLFHQLQIGQANDCRNEEFKIQASAVFGR